MKEKISYFMDGFVLFIIICVVSGLNFNYGVESFLAQNYFYAGCSFTATLGLLVGLVKFVWYLK